MKPQTGTQNWLKPPNRQTIIDPPLMQTTKVTESEYDSSSNEEICEAEDLVEEGNSDLGNQQITRHVDFLVGVTSRFGRPVRVNSRFVL